MALYIWVDFDGVLVVLRQMGLCSKQGINALPVKLLRGRSLGGIHVMNGKRECIDACRVS